MAREHLLNVSVRINRGDFRGILSNREIDDWLNLTARFLADEYERTILKPVRLKTPRVTGRLRRSMVVRRGRGLDQLIDVYAEDYQKFVPVSRSRSVADAIERFERPRIQLAVERAVTRAFNNIRLSPPSP